MGILVQEAAYLYSQRVMQTYIELMKNIFGIFFSSKDRTSNNISVLADFAEHKLTYKC